MALAVMLDLLVEQRVLIVQALVDLVVVELLAMQVMVVLAVHLMVALVQQDQAVVAVVEMQTLLQVVALGF
jgi:hypothetical protein